MRGFRCVDETGEQGRQLRTCENGYDQNRRILLRRGRTEVRCGSVEVTQQFAVPERCSRAYDYCGTEDMIPQRNGSQKAVCGMQGALSERRARRAVLSIPTWILRAQ
ncbi:hypothetical protein CSOJ01_03729 [Colletotrichum sojae]|uniref:Uncharacterized protein n=1 Tax=Colletotrichum sojae TaxID=2175907 RepID=A0A8H6JLH6_9PEZI|nr:hypothetical protein CSOJ01_03729 [Colletotrichum sojae]